MIGLVDGKDVPLRMTPAMRSTHLYICGATGTGKSKMLEPLIRQDIKNWYDSKCGALIINPHGSPCDSVTNRRTNPLLQTFLPRFALIGSAGEHENVRVREICAGVLAGEIALFDKPYLDFAHLAG